MCTFITARHNATQYYYYVTTILPSTTLFFLLIIGLLTHGIYQIISNQKTQGLLRRRHEGIANNQGQ